MRTIDETPAIILPGGYEIGPRQQHAGGVGICAKPVRSARHARHARTPDAHLCGAPATSVRVHRLGDDELQVFFCASHDDIAERYDGED